MRLNVRRDVLFGSGLVGAFATVLAGSVWSLELADSRERVTAFVLALTTAIVGAGLNAFGTATHIYQTSGDAHYAEAHNDYLQILAEGGITLAVIVAVLVALVALQINRQFALNRDLQDLYWIRVGATLGLLAIALQDSVEFSLQMPGNAVLFVVLLTMALHAPQRSAQPAAS